MNLIEMEGFLRGKCLPGDMLVNETNAQYLVRKISSMNVQRIELEDQCKALAAENAALKAFGSKLNEMHNDLNGEGTGIQGRAEVACQQVALEAAMEEFDAIKTTATDAFLAEVRAQGVEMYAEHLTRRAIASGKNKNHAYAYLAANFAAQLRKVAI